MEGQLRIAVSYSAEAEHRSGAREMLHHDLPLLYAAIWRNAEPLIDANLPTPHKNNEARYLGQDFRVRSSLGIGSGLTNALNS